MRSDKRFNRILTPALATCLAVGAMMTGCGGGGGGDSAAPAAVAPVNTDQTVSGTAAFGSPMAGATITLTDSAGATKTTTAAADGTYSFLVNGLKAPFLLTASGVSGDTLKTYSALLATAPASGAVTNVNVTPITDAIVALASSTGNNPAEFSDVTVLKNLNTTRLKQAETAVIAIIGNVATDLGLPATFNPVTTAFSATLGTPGDQLLETIKVSVTDTGVTMTNALVAVSATGSSASATTTIKDVTTDAATALPKSAVPATFNTLLTTLRTQLNTCLALAPTARVTLDTSTTPATPTALIGACAASSMTAFASTYKHNGYDLLGAWGPRFRDLPQGASAGQPEIIGTFAQTDLTTKLVVNIPVSVESGGVSYGDTLSTNTAGVWSVSGNQRKYDMSMSARLYRSTDISTNPLVPTTGPDAGKNVGRVSRYEISLGLNFNPTGPNASKVYAVRVKGPGLPDAGYVMGRSDQCGTGTALAVYSSDGTLPNATGKTAAFESTHSSISRWTISVVPFGTDYKGTDLLNQMRGWTGTGTGSTQVSSGPVSFSGSATPTYYSPTNINLKDIPEFANYTWEIWSIDSTGAISSETIPVFNTDRLVGPDAGTTFKWSVPSATTLSYLKPDSLLAGLLTSATLDWTIPSGAPFVIQADLNGTATPSRFNASETVRPVGSLSMTVAPSSETKGLGEACTTNTMFAVSATTSRGIQLDQRGNRVLMRNEYQHIGRIAVP